MKFKFKKEFFSEYHDNYLTVVNLTKQYKRNMPPAISNLNFSVGPGEFHVFIGGNGAGKTTTIKSIIGAYSKYEGKIYFSGYINTSLNAKRTLGYIPEIAKFPENTSAYSYLYTMAILSEIPKSEAKQLVNKILFDLQMEKLAKKSPNTFSSGQKKKILLAQALLHDPKILIMDEPAANLDPRARIEFFNALKQLQMLGKTIFISSHILNEVDKYATHATILDGGKIVFSGDLNRFRNKNNPQMKIQVNKKNIFRKILEDLSIKYTYEPDNNTFLLEKITNDKLKKIFLKIVNKNLQIISLKNTHLSLEDIYYEYVIKGSVHTMK